MATATPYRWAKSAPPGSTLCPYCEVVYSGVGNGTHCATCGTKLVVLQSSLVAVEAASGPPLPAVMARREESAPAGFRQNLLRGFTGAARVRWLVPLWATLLTIAGALVLDRLILPPHRLTTSTDIAPLLTIGTGMVAFFLALTALVSLCGGMILGLVLRETRFPAAALGGSAIAFAHLSFTDLTPTTFTIVLAHPLLWVVGAMLSGMAKSESRVSKKNRR